MSRTFAEWLTDSRAKTLLCVFVAAVFTPSVPFALWVPGALLVLLSLVPSAVPPLSGLLLAAAAIVGLTTEAVGPWPALILAACLLLPQYLLGRLLARGASPNLSFQMAAVAALGMLVVIYLVLADPAGVWRPVKEQLMPTLERVADMMDNAGSGHRLDDKQIVEESFARAWGLVAWLLLLNTMVSVLFGVYWARGKGYVPPGGSSFSSLSAGKTLAYASLVAVGCALLFSASRLPGDALLVFGGVFMLQGLSILHSAMLAMGFGGVSLGLGYAAGFLVFLLAALVVPALSWSVQSLLVVSGLVDNWLPIRDGLRSLVRRGS